MFTVMMAQDINSIDRSTPVFLPTFFLISLSPLLGILIHEGPRFGEVPPVSFLLLGPCRSLEDGPQQMIESNSVIEGGNLDVKIRHT